MKNFNANLNFSQPLQKENGLKEAKKDDLVNMIE